MRVEVVDEDPRHVGDGTALRPTGAEEEQHDRAVPDPELDPALPIVPVAAELVGRSETKRVRQPACSSRRLRTQELPPRSAPPAGIVAATVTVVPPAAGVNWTSTETSSTALSQASSSPGCHVVIRPSSSASLPSGL
jgi:hypothetical protein